MITRIPRRDWAFAILIALIAVGILSLPYLFAYLTAREGWVFMGLLMNPEDSQTYFAKMLQGFDGRFLYTIPFTIEKHPGAFVGVFYVYLGHIARLLGISLTAMWHLSRVVADLFLFLTTFGFIATFVADRHTRLTAYLLAIFGSGLGWVLFLLNQPHWLGAFPVDFKQPEAHPFFTALTFPHAALGTALTMIILWFLLQLTSTKKTLARKWFYVIAAGVTNIALGIIYPFLIYLIAAVALLYWVYLVAIARRILWRQGILYAVTFIIPAPLFLYYAYTLQSNAVFRAWDIQAGTPSLPWPHYLVAYGLMLLLALVHWYKRPSLRSRFVFLWIWVLATAILLYAPLRPQRRFVQGVHIPLSILSTAAFLQILLPRLERTRLWQALIALPRYSTARLHTFVTALFLFFMTLSNIYILASVSVSAVIQQPDTLFRPEAEVQAASWLRKNGDASGILLSDYLTGNYVAAWSGQHVVLGHWAETVDYEEKGAAVERFFSAGTSDKWRRDLLSHYQVDYVWFGPRERLLGEFDPEKVSYLQPLYTYDTITIYTVQSAGAGG